MTCQNWSDLLLDFYFSLQFLLLLQILTDHLLNSESWEITLRIEWLLSEWALASTLFEPVFECCSFEEVTVLGHHWITHELVGDRTQQGTQALVIVIGCR